jgi:ABC-type uncharacterized transport system auxiliary subunit
MKKIFKPFLLFFILLIGCAGTPSTNLYLLHISQTKVETESTPIKIGIHQFTINPIYSNHGIAYQHSPYQIQFYHYHQWAGDPAKLINQTLLSYLKQSNQFSLVCQLPSANEVDYQVQGKILKFSEWNEGEKWYGWLELDVQIAKENSNEIIWKGKISKKIPTEKKNPVSVVKALSEATKQIAEEIAKKIIKS